MLKIYLYLWQSDFEATLYHKNIYFTIEYYQNEVRFFPASCVLSHACVLCK